MTGTLHVPAVEAIDDSGRAELLLDPLRQRILAEAREPSTAAEIARRLDLPAQNVNYHVRTLVEAGFLRPAGEGRKRNLVEKRYRASARSYVIVPRVLGEVGSTGPSEADRFSASHLMSLGARLVEEVAAWFREEGGAGENVPTLSIDTELRFASSEQRAAFAEALQEAVTGVVGRFSDPARYAGGGARQGRPYRLLVGCYPVPDPPDDDVNDAPDGDGEEESET